MSRNPYTSDWTWLDNPPSEALGYAGKVTLELLRNAPRWVNRRVERISFHDTDTADHQITIDFSLPPDLPSVGKLNKSPVYVVPVSLLAKRPRPALDSKKRLRRIALYSRMELTDETGKHLPRITGRQSARIAGAVLRTFADELLDTPLDREQDNLITRMTVGGPVGRAHALAMFFGKNGGDGSAPATLAGHGEFRELAYALANHWIVLTLFVESLPKRSLVTLSYREQLQHVSQSKEEEARRSLGWKSKLYYVRINEIGAAATYHTEIDVPPELEITEVGLFGRKYQAGGHSNVKLIDLESLEERHQSGQSQHLRFPRVAKALMWVLQELLGVSQVTPDTSAIHIRQIGCTGVGHLYIPGPAERRVGVAWVKLRVRRRGFLIGALLASMITSAVLISYACSAKAIAAAQVSDAAVTLLLLVPTLIATYVARPGEHSITAHMLRWARLALVANGALPFIAAVRLLTVSGNASEQAMALESTWGLLAKISLAFVVLFGMSNVLPQPHGKPRYDVTHVEKDDYHPSGDQ